MSKPSRWEPLERASLWRKIAVGMWGRPSDPNILGMLTVEVDQMLDYLDQVREVTQKKVTPTAFLVKTMAKFFEAYPDLNVIVVGNEVRRRKNIDIFCQVAIPSEDGSEADLSGVKLPNCDKLDLVEVAQMLHHRAGKVRDGDDDDEDVGQSRQTIDRIPSPLRPLLIRAIEFLTYEVPIDLESWGLPADPFGSAMVSSVGQFDVDQAFAPLVPASRCPLVALPGAVREAPVVVDGELAVRKVMTISTTADHRC